DEAVRNLRRPLAKRRRCLCAIESAVDLDRGEAARRVAKLLRMRQAVGVEHTPPRRKSPTADADVDVRGRHGLSQLGFGRCRFRRGRFRCGRLGCGRLGHDARPSRSLTATLTYGAAVLCESRICSYLDFRRAYLETRARLRGHEIQRELCRMY